MDDLTSPFPITAEPGESPLRGSDGPDLLLGSADADVIDGRSGNDLLLGLAGDDTLIGGLGNDTMNGGDGVDTVSYAGTAQVIVDLATGQASGGAGYDTLISIENVIGGVQHDTLTGNAQANRLDGGDGNDTMTGGGGDDVYVVNQVGDVVVESSASGGVDTIIVSVSGYTLAANVENMVVKFGTGYGNDLANVITADPSNSMGSSLNGGAGDDTLIGGYTNDVLEGSSGIDTVSYAGMTSAVQISLAVVTQQFNQGASYDTLLHIENLIGGSGNDTLTGSTLANVIEGGLGNDVIDGAAGVDTASYAGSNAAVNVSLALTTAQNTGGAGTDTLSNIENLQGGSGNDTLTGNAADNALAGGGGDDVLVGGLGNDTLDGGDGIDTASYSGSAAVTVSLAVTIAQNTGGAGTDTLSNIENLLGGSGNDALTGNAQANRLDGGAGSDTLAGGAGNDVYVVDNAGDSVVEGSGAGEADTVIARVSGHTLAANVENLVLDGVQVGNGNALANLLTGDGGNNSLNGGDADDTLIGGLGNDVLDGGNGSGDTVSYAGSTAGITANLAVTGTQNTGGAGVDKLLNVEHLIGGSGNDALAGNALDNRLEGGLGNDTLLGGAGSDTASYASSTAAVTVTLAISSAQATGGAGIDRLIDIENLLGGSGNDVLTGNGGNNALTGGLGDDTLTGGLGDDRLDGGDGQDTANYADQTAALTINLSVSTMQNTGAGLDTLIGIENLIGGSGNDAFTGNSAANRLAGGQGADTLTGGTGNDTYFVDNAGDVVVETSTDAGEIDTVNAHVDGYTLSANVENLLLQGPALAGTGNALANLLVGTAGNNTLNGGGGDDTLIGGLGNDVLAGGAGTGDTASYADSVAAVTVSLAVTTAQNTGGAGTDTLTDIENLIGGFNHDALTGNALANRLEGGTGSDTLTGGAGIDTLIGGFGDDVYGVDNASDVMSEEADAGIDTVAVQFSGYTLGANLENLRLEGAALTGSGNALANRLIGNAGNNIFNGGNGDDTLLGGMGNDILDGGSGWGDTASYEDATAAVMVSLAVTSAQNTGGAGSDTLANIENLIGGSGNDALTGNALDNRLAGGAGQDTLTGGGGNDTYVVDNAGDVIVEAAIDADIDTVISSVDYTLAANVENLYLTGSARVGVGNARSNMIRGSDGNDTLSGGSGGADTLVGGLGDDSLSGGSLLIGGVGNDTLSLGGLMIGGAGDDVYVITPSTSGIYLSNYKIQEGAGLEGGIDTLYTNLNFYGDVVLAANVENLYLTGTAERGHGNDLDNLIVGNASNNLLSGGNGNDTIVGGLGNDTLDGLNGNNTVSYADCISAVTIDLRVTVAQETGASGNDMLRNFANAIGGSGNDELTGAEYANRLDGGLGSDTLIGLAGNDTYVIDNAGDVIVEESASATEIDTVVARISGYTLGVNLENLTLEGPAKTGSGNALSNLLTGNAANNIFNGGLGDDTLLGGLGDDILDGGSGMGDTASYADSLAAVTVSLALTGAQNTLGAGSDTLVNIEGLIGGSGNDLLIGNSGANRLTGGAGNDTLAGGAGNDTLVGGTGNDVYRFSGGVDTIIEADNTAGNIDVVEFASGVTKEQLSVQHVGSNLEIGITGTGDKLILQNFYGGLPYHAEQFRFSNGDVLTDSQLLQMVQAMASFAPSPTGLLISSDDSQGRTPIPWLAVNPR